MTCSRHPDRRQSHTGCGTYRQEFSQRRPKSLPLRRTQTTADPSEHPLSEWPRRLVQLLQFGHIRQKVANSTHAPPKSERAVLVSWRCTRAIEAGASDAPTISPAAALSLGRPCAGDFSSDFLDSKKRFRRRGWHKFLDTRLLGQLGRRSAAAGMGTDVDPL